MRPYTKTKSLKYKIWVKGELIEVDLHHVDAAGIQYVLNERGRFVPKGEEILVETDQLFTKMLKYWERTKVKKPQQERPFSVDYGLNKDEPYPENVAVIKTDREGYSSQMQPDNERFLQNRLIALPIKFISLSPSAENRSKNTTNGKHSGRRVGS